MNEYEIEDRTKRESPSFGAGKWVVWNVRRSPIPCRLFIGLFETKEAAQWRVNALISGKGGKAVRHGK